MPISDIRTPKCRNEKAGTSLLGSPRGRQAPRSFHYIPDAAVPRPARMFKIWWGATCDRAHTIEGQGQRVPSYRGSARSLPPSTPPEHVAVQRRLHFTIAARFLISPNSLGRRRISTITQPEPSLQDTESIQLGNPSLNRVRQFLGIHWRELLELDEQHDGVHHAEPGITDSRRRTRRCGRPSSLCGPGSTS